jgi:hypothetical protein
MTRSAETPDSPQSLAVARGRAYDLLGHGLRHGVTADRLAHLRAVPALVPHLPTSAEFDADEAAAHHHTALVLEIAPFESVFLTEAGLMGGPAAAAVRAQANRVGFPGMSDDMEPDHVGIELAVLCWLSGAEADAIADGQAAVAAELQARTGAFLDAHPLGWIDVLARSMATCPAVDPVLTEMARLASELCHSHRASLGPPVPVAALPPLPDLLDDPDTGLRRIADVLTTPALAGGYLTSSAIGALGRAHRLPRGFGGRCQMLVNLLRSAAQFDRVSEVCVGLEATVTAWSAAEQDDRWTTRASETLDWLQRMRERVVALSEDAVRSTGANLP